MKDIIYRVVLICFSIIIGAVLLFSAYLLPTSSILQNALYTKHNGSVLVMDGDHPRWGRGGSSGLDNFTDSIMISIATYDIGSNSAVQEALLNHWLTTADKEIGFYDNLLSMGREGVDFNKDYPVAMYGRYWHGYQIILKPLLSLTNMQTIRELNMVLLFGMICFVLLMINNILGKYYACSFAVVILFMNPITMALSMQFMDVILITLGILALMLCRNRFILQRNWYMYLFLMAGIFTAYFDLLTYPLVSLGFPLILYVLMNKDFLISMQLCERIKVLTANIFSWIAGYVGMWTGKWILISMLTDVNIFDEVFNAAKYHMAVTESTVNYTIISTWKSNMADFSSGPTRIIFILLCLYILFNLFKNRIRLNNPIIISLAVIALLPLGWYAALCEHSSMHSWFTFREYAISLFALLAIVCELQQNNTVK